MALVESRIRGPLYLKPPAKEQELNTLKDQIINMANIPANEQSIGHFQMAVIGVLTEMLVRIERLERDKLDKRDYDRPGIPEYLPRY